MTRRKRYSAEFKREALRRANEPGVTDVLVAEELGINARMLRYWRDAAKRDGENAFPGLVTRGIRPISLHYRSFTDHATGTHTNLASATRISVFSSPISSTSRSSAMASCWSAMATRASSSSSSNSTRPCCFASSFS